MESSRTEPRTHKQVAILFAIGVAAYVLIRIGSVAGLSSRLYAAAITAIAVICAIAYLDRIEKLSLAIESASEVLDEDFDQIRSANLWVSANPAYELGPVATFACGMIFVAGVASTPLSTVGANEVQGGPLVTQVDLGTSESQTVRVSVIRSRREER